MPAKLAIPSRVRIVVPTTYLNFSNTNQGYISAPLRLNGNGGVIVSTTKLYFIALSVTFIQDVVFTYYNTNNNNTINYPQNYVIPINTAQIQVFRNNNTILQSFKSFNESDRNTLYTSGYINLNAGDVITASISFTDTPVREIKDIQNIEDKENQKVKIKGAASPFTVGPPTNVQQQVNIDADTDANAIQDYIETRGSNNAVTININVLPTPTGTFLNIV